MAVRGKQNACLRQRKRVVSLLQDVMVALCRASREEILRQKLGLAVYYLLRNLIEFGMISSEDRSKTDKALSSGLEILSSYTTVRFATMDEGAFMAVRECLTTSNQQSIPPVLLG